MSLVEGLKLILMVERKGRFLRLIEEKKITSNEMREKETGKL